MGLAFAAGWLVVKRPEWISKIVNDLIAWIKGKIWKAPTAPPGGMA